MRWRSTNAQRRAVAGDQPGEPAIERARRSRPGLRVLRRAAAREHIIGVSVSEITADSVIAIASVTANSRNSRPTMPPMNSSGMNTASSDAVMLTIVKPICLAPVERGLAAATRRPRGGA